MVVLHIKEIILIILVLSLNTTIAQNDNTFNDLTTPIKQVESMKVLMLFFLQMAQLQLGVVMIMVVVF